MKKTILESYRPCNSICITFLKDRIIETENRLVVPGVRDGSGRKVGVVIKGPHVRFCGDGDVYYLDCGSGYIILLRIKLPRTRCTQIHTYK